MYNNLKIFFTCINEEKLIEAKIQWGLRLGAEISVVEGHHPNYKGLTDPNGLSVDETTEILIGYSDQIKYLPIGKVNNQLELRSLAYKNLSHKPGICIMSDVDEFYLEKDLIEIDHMYKRNKDLKETVTNSYIFLDNTYCAPHIQHIDGGPVKFNKKWTFNLGQWHERVFLFNKYYDYNRTPFLINDIYGRFPFTDSAYFGDREVLPNIYMLHFKNFKLEEAKARHKMYQERGDKIDYNKEWDLLEKNKIEYKGEHPIEIKRLMK